MKRVKTLNANTLKDTMKKGGCEIAIHKIGFHADRLFE